MQTFPPTPTTRLRALIAFFSLVALAMVAMLPAAARAAGAVERVTTPAGAARAYWTPERMSAATPVEPAVTGAPARAGAGFGGAVAADPSYVAGARAGEPARARLRAGGPAQRTRALGLGVTRDEIADPSTPDSRPHGKVFFTIPQGSEAGDYVCSGTAVNSRNHSVVWTAGHCVFDLAGGFATNWIFVPAYKDGAAPYGEWPARRLETTAGWKTSANLRYDVGAAVVTKSATTGQRLQEAVGARGIGFDQPRDQFFSAYGYPAVAPPLEFTGEREFRCLSNSAGTDQPVGSGPSTMAINCDMTGGASGGGWIVGTTLLSVTSYGYAVEPDRLFGPYMSASAKELYKSVRGAKKRTQQGTKGTKGGRGGK